MGPAVAGGEKVPDQPGIAVTAAGDHDGVAAGLLQHVQSVAGGEQVAAADDRNGERLLQAADLFPVGAAAEALGSGAGVQGDGVGPFLDGKAADLQVILGPLVPSRADLDRQRQGSTAANGGDHLRHPQGLTQHGAAGTGADDLGDRATEVEVDQLAGAGELRSRAGHGLRVLAEELHRQRSLLGNGVQQFPGSPAVADQAVGADHLREDQAGAEPLHDQPIGKVGDSRHGGEKDVVRELQ